MSYHGGLNLAERHDSTLGLPVASENAPEVTGVIQGQLLRRSEHRTVAMYLRDGAMWVADFIDGQGTLVDVNTWFRFNCGTPANSHAMRRMALESALPLSQELTERIEALHHAAVTQRSREPIRFVQAVTAHLPGGPLATMVACRFRRRRSHQAHSGAMNLDSQ